MPDYTKRRIRHSLNTTDLLHAKILRDMLFHDINIKPL